MRRRTLLTGLGAVSLGAVASAPTSAYATTGPASATTAGDTSPAPNLYPDNRFRDGFDLMPVEPSTTPREVLDFGTPGVTPRWHLAEWYTKHSIADTPLRHYRLGDLPDPSLSGVGYESPSKRVVRSDDGRLWLEALASKEYDRPRQDGEPWPHLLIERVWDAAGPRLADLTGLQLQLRVRVDHILDRMDPADYDPTKHAAQVTLFFTVQNRNRASADYGSLVWFGVPVVDSRYDIPPAYYAEDSGHTGQTNQFIASMPGTDFWPRSVKDGRWHTTDRDLLPFMRTAFAIAQERGYLPVTAYDDLRITTSNLGWELPGTFDVAFELAPLIALQY